ncbi:MAG: DUF2802 domain-containing protein [Legionella sp.]|nr:MAG: DUF2802 domain-containing protein [Legionella sp.]
MFYMSLAVNFVLGLLFLQSLSTRRKNQAKVNERIQNLEQTVSELTREHSPLINADLVLARQLREINMQMNSMDNQLQDIANTRSNDGGYQHALGILEMGGSKEEIINSCHLSNAEAELLVNLHAYRAAIKV